MRHTAAIHILIKYLLGSNLKLFLGGIGASLMASLAGIGLLTLAAYLICSAALQPPLYTLALSITMVRACGIGRAVFRYLERLLLHDSAFSTLESIKLSMYGRAAQLLPLKEGPTYSAKLMTQLSNGSDILRDFYLRAFAPPILTLLLTLIGFAMLWNISAMASFILLVSWAFAVAIPLLRAGRGTSAEVYEGYRQSLIDYQIGASELLTAYQKNNKSSYYPNIQEYATISSGDEGRGCLSYAEFSKDNAFSYAAGQYGNNLLNCKIEDDPVFDRLFKKNLELLALQENRENNRELTTSTAVAMLLNAALVAIFALLILSVNRGLINGIQMAVYLLAVQGIITEQNNLPEAIKYFIKALDTVMEIGDLTAKEKENALNDTISDFNNGRKAEKNINNTNKAFKTETVENCNAGVLLETNGLVFSYNKGMPLINGLSFSILEGHHTAIIGESGCGKSTLSYLLTGLFQPDGGTISLNTKIAAGLQNHYIFSGTIRSSFQRLCDGIEDAEIIHALQIACLYDTLKSLVGNMASHSKDASGINREEEQILNFPLEQNASNLSGGQRQRLIAALALAANPATHKLLLLDEPTSGLDKATALRLAHNLIKHCNDAHQTLLLITHEPEIAALFRAQLLLK